MAHSDQKKQKGILFGAIAAVLALLVLTVVDAQQNKEVRRNGLKTQLEQVASRISVNTQQLAQFFSKQDLLSASCNDEVITTLRHEQFESMLVSEFGLTDSNGNLRCTSWQKLDPPIPVETSSLIGELRVHGPILVKYLEKQALVLAKGRSDGSEINALVPVQHFRDLTSDIEVTDGYVALIDTESGTPYMIEGNYSLPIGEQRIAFPLRRNVEFEGELDNLEVHYLVTHNVEPWPLAIIAAESVAAMDRGIYRFSEANLLIALVLGGIVFVAFYKIEEVGGSLSDRIQLGMRHYEFRNYYQPIIDAKTGNTIAVEILLRWHHPEEGVLPPSVFIPEAERGGLILPITDTIIENASRELENVIAGNPDLKVNINISGQHLKAPAFTQKVSEHLDRLPNLMLELTENELVDYQNEEVIAAFNELRAKNVRFAIDDFGTGYSGLTYLEQLPIDVIKIDRSFVAACGTDSPGAILLENMVNLAKSLKMETVAEGVETAEQAEYLMQRGVHLHQGWRYARAMRIADLQDFLAGKHVS